MKKSVYRKAAETLANKTLRDTPPISSEFFTRIGDFSCYHLDYHAGNSFSDKTQLFLDTFAFPPTINDDDWWNKHRKTPKQLLAASLALLFMEYLDETL